MLHVICTRLCPGHLRVRVGDGSRRSKEIVKKKSRIGPLNAIIIIIIFVIIVVVVVIIIIIIKFLLSLPRSVYGTS